MVFTTLPRRPHAEDPPYPEREAPFLALAPGRLARELALHAGLSLVTHQGQRIEVRTDFDSATLQRLLAALEAAS